MGGDVLAAWCAAAAAAGQPVLVVDARLHLACASAEASALCRLPPVGEPLRGALDVVALGARSSEDAAWDALPFVRAVTTRTQQRALGRLRRSDGSEVTLDLVAVPLRDGDEVVGAVCFAAPV